PAIIYPGSIERIDFGERKEQKGFCLVTINNTPDINLENKTNFEFIKTPTRNLIQIEVKLQANKDQTTQILEELDKHDLNGAIIKILYHVPENEKDKIDLQIIQKKCEPAMHLVGIIPIRENQVRERRSDLKISMDFETLIGAYLDTKPDLKNRKQELVDKALVLFEESKINQIEE
ncbi:MAG: hypothetical protein ACD_82C00197G0001, partial [uncultured bacterium]